MNVQPGQLLVINAPIECAAFARLLCEKGYDAGAGDVFIFWNDELLRKLRLERAGIAPPGRGAAPGSARRGCIMCRGKAPA